MQIPYKERDKRKYTYTEVPIMSKDSNNRRNRQEREVMRAARHVEELIATAAATRTTTVQRKNGVKRRKLDPNGEPAKRRGAYRVSFKDLSNGDGYVNALYTKADDRAKEGIKTSMSVHVAFEHKNLGKIISVVIPKATTSQPRKKSKKLANGEIGDWVKENVTDWKKGVWFSRIGHTNVISDQPLDLNRDITGYVLISSKRVEQNTRKGKNMYYFPHIIILGTREKTKPVFRLIIDNVEGENVPGTVHIGPTIGALLDNKKVEEYLHLIPCK